MGPVKRWALYSLLLLLITIAVLAGFSAAFNLNLRGGATSMTLSFLLIIGVGFILASVRNKGN